MSLRPHVLSLLVTLASTSVLAGCGLQVGGTTTAVSTASTTTSGGRILGGQQPVSGATVTLYTVGTTATASAATALYSTTSDANGGFALSSGTTKFYTCPTTTSLVYIVATGGNPGLTSGTNNTGISLMTALGPCSNLTTSTFIQINELTTVAAVSSLSAYMTSASTVGSTTAAAASLAAAFNVATELVNTSTGVAPGVSVPTGYTAPATLINTLGDIAAACINSTGGVEADGSACGQLFYYTHVYGSAVPTDTVTALLRLALNPNGERGQLDEPDPRHAPVPSGYTTSPPSYRVLPGAACRRSHVRLIPCLRLTTVYTVRRPRSR